MNNLMSDEYYQGLPIMGAAWHKDRDKNPCFLFCKI